MVRDVHAELPPLAGAPLYRFVLTNTDDVANDARLARLQERWEAERAKLTPEQVALADQVAAETERVFLFGREVQT